MLKWGEPPKKEEIPTEIWYNEITTKQNTNSEEFLMNIITQEAKKRQAVVKLAEEKVMQAESMESACQA